MRDVLFLPLNNEKEIVISTDCSGAIGEKAGDEVYAPDRIVAYFSMRVAMMELMAVGGSASAVILSNFTGDQAWSEYMEGIQQVFTELEISPLPVIGSSETNMSLLQSAVGLTVLGGIYKERKRIKRTPADACFAVIGEPLVGAPVLTEKERVAPLSLFRKLLEIAEIYEVVPIGSKGILYEFGQLLKDNNLSDCNVHCFLDLYKSSGPATCFLISYSKSAEEMIQQVAGRYYYNLHIQS